MQANLRTLAANEIAVAVAHDRDAAGSQVALPLGFVEALESAISDSYHHQLTGTLRFAKRQPAAATGVNLVRVQWDVRVVPHVAPQRSAGSPNSR